MGCEQSEILPMGNIRNMLQSQDSEHGQANRGQQYPQQYQQQQFQQYGAQNYNQPQKVGTAYPPPNNHRPPGPPVQHKGGSSHNMDAPQTEKKHMLPREHLDHTVNYEDDFLAHHLRYELSLTKLTNMKRIRRRQIFEHLWLQVYWGNMGGVKELGINFQGYQQSLVSSFIQRTFLDIWEKAHDDLFVKHIEAKAVRRKVAEQFMFQLFEVKEYVDSGMASINFALDKTRCSLYDYCQASDEALFHLFKKLKERYPMTSDMKQINFPDVPSTKTTANLLNNFHTLCFSDPDNMNYQTIYEDMNFLLRRAIQEQDDFKNDMKDILGDDVLACPKVGQVNKDGNTSFNACAVRRVFVKWCENLLQKCPDLQYTKTFMLFIKAKSRIVNNFFFKSTVQPTTHKIVLDCISLLLELAKFGLKDKKQREQFIFNIYDLLRCKIKRGNPQSIVDILEKMKSTKVTKSGKKFEVLRVKNRFKTSCRDLLVNFRYGDVLVGEAQLGVDSSELSKQAKLNYEFCHYIYELERSLFGPTIELMMQYEDFQRPDITVDFEAQDLVIERRDEHISHAGPVKRKCLQGHDMISLKGNFFFPPQTKDQTEDQTIAAEYPAICNYCDSQSTVQTPYDYCYHCGCYLCKQCYNNYQKVNTKQFWLSIMREEVLPQLKSMSELESLCAKNKSMIVLFWLQNSSASGMYKDAIIYQQGKLMMQPGKYLPKIAAIKYEDTTQFKKFIKKYHLKAYPSLVLLDQKAKPFRTIIGFSWFETPNLYLTQKRMIEGEDVKNMSQKCVACESLVECTNAEQIEGGGDQNSYQDEDLDNYEGQLQMFKCLNCFGTSKPIDAPKQYQKLQFSCDQGHRRCLNCCYAISDVASTFKDFMGGDYLSSTFVNPQLKKCPKGHQTILSRKDPVNAWEFVCFSCKQKRFFDNEHGVGQCSKCQEYLCSRCLGANRPTFNEILHRNKPNLVRHFVESTAEQACLCICQNHFKKAYCGRILKMEELKDQNTKGWKCFLCQTNGKNGQLHMACFACPTISQALGQKMNFEICLKCATKSNMLMRQPPKKVKQIPSLFTCPKDNKPMVQTTFAYKKKLVVGCHYCKKKYFGNTQRFACLSCDLNCCMNCRQKLWKGNPPRCPQKCMNGHALKFEFVKPNSLEYCDGCMTVMRNEAFKCAEDDYVLCMNCVQTNPPNFIGTVLQNLRNLSNNQGQPQIFDEQEEDDGFDIDRPFEEYEQQSQGFDLNLEDAFDW